ncbi:hypothetical protein [Leptospira alstonii]|uniref:Uncharacterized protein n=1 Tax=Leptospira alstonii serovar Sichuan str. 79601 TaxID=1218565 RepID=M6CU85_9LEPT|nr:hypothetical protein [Leptospira alstonii]AGS80498.1 hypothetical protein LEP1GSC193_0733 [Leptospira phage vB_LalZ_80412-LE1]EMJ95472.1 hypothetical protein LEP1GSC194_3533 [Leptospira alstonii serovar Sichuan str. 79601]
MALNKLLERLPQFNETDPTFKELFGDKSRPEYLPTTNVNDINVGALFNSVEWHLRYQELATHCAVLSNTEGHFLRKWAELLGIERPLNMNDPEFVGYILGYVLSNEPTIPKIGQIFQRPDFAVLRCNELGFATDVSASDTGLFLPGPDTNSVSSIVTPDRGVSYIVAENLSSFKDIQITQLNRILAAGTAVFLGAKNGN